MIIWTPQHCDDKTLFNIYEIILSSLSDAGWDVCHQALQPGEPASHDQAGGTGLLSHFEEDDI